MKCYKFENSNESCTEWQYDRNEFQQSINTEVIHLKNNIIIPQLIKLCSIV